MSTNGLAAFSPQGATLGTLLANFGDAVGVQKERTYRFMRAVNKTATDQTVTVVVGAGGFAIAFELTVPAKDGITIVGGGTVVGPLPTGTQLQARASAASAIDLYATGTDRSF